MAVKVRMDGVGYVRTAGMQTVGDITALTIYQAAQPRPVTKIELASLGLMVLSSEEVKPPLPAENSSVSAKMIRRPWLPISKT